MKMNADPLQTNNAHYKHYCYTQWNWMIHRVKINDIPSQNKF